MEGLTKTRSGTTILIAFLGLIISVGSQAGAAREKNVFTFGVVPQQTASHTVRSWSPFVEYVKQTTGIELKLQTAKNIPVFERRTSEGRYDIAYMNPYHYVVFHESSGYEAFAKAKDKKLTGVIVVRKDSGIKSLEDLKQKGDLKVALPSPKAFAASLLVRQALRDHKIRFIPVYVSSHDSVYKNISRGFFIAGGGVPRTLNASSEKIRNSLKILYKTKGYTPHAFAYHERVPFKVIRRIQEAMIDIESSPEGVRALSNLKIKGFEAGTDSEWDDVRKLNVGMFN